MKKLLTITTLSLLVGLNAYSQGYVNFANVGAGISGALIQHRTSLEAETYANAPAGAQYKVQLFYANGVVTDAAALRAVDTPPVNFAAAGIVNAGGRNIAGITPGGVGSFQIRAWSAVLGDDWDTAFQAWSTGPRDLSRQLGSGNVFQVTTKDGTLRPLPTPAGLVGQQGFRMDVVPEPSTIALAILGGLGALVAVRRRK